MAIGKRQLVLATLVVALGAAVYLNWTLSGNQLSASNAVTSNSSPTIGAAQLVNNSGSKTTSGTASAKSSSAVTTGANAEDYFAQACLSRQKARDTSLELLTKALSNAQANDNTKKEAVEQTKVIAENVMKENSIDNLVKAKGFSNCVAFIENGSCSVVVQKSTDLQANDIVTIKDIVNTQTGISFDKIKISGHK